MRVPGMRPLRSDRPPNPQPSDADARRHRKIPYERIERERHAIARGAAFDASASLDAGIVLTFAPSRGAANPRRAPWIP